MGTYKLRSDITLSKEKTYKSEIEAKLRSVIRKRNIVNAVKGFAATLIIAALLFFIFDLTEFAGRFNADVRTVFVVIFLLSISISSFLFIIVPLFKNFPLFTKINYPETAAVVGNHFPFIKDDLKNVLQLIENKNSHTSNDLAEKAFKVVYEKTKETRFDEVVDAAILKKYSLNALAVLSAVIILVLSIPGFNSSAYRLVNFSEEFIEPPRFTLLVEPGNKTLTKGEDVLISIRAAGDKPSQIKLEIKSEEQTEFQTIKINADSLGNFSHKISTVKNSFEYYASAQNIKSDLFKIEIINRPVISDFKVEVIPPSYSKLPKIVQRDNGNISTLKGSRVNISLNASKQLDSAYIDFNRGSNIILSVVGASASASFGTYFNEEYFISIKDKEGIENEFPIKYSISVEEDEYPTIDIVAPGKDIKLADDDRVSLITKITDDFGFSKLILNYRLSASRYEQTQSEFSKIQIPFDTKSNEKEVYYVWDLAELYLGTDDVVSYYLEIFDNDVVSGPKSTKTDIYTVRVPSLDEIFAEAENTQETSEMELVETLEEAQKLSDELENIKNELKQDSEEITYEEKTKIEDALEKFKELESKVEAVQESLSKMQNELQDNNLLSEETLKKYLELQELMDELSNDNMLEAFKKMQEMMEKLSRQETQQALDNLEMNEDAFKKSLERTINLLKRLQIEQKVDELNKRTEDLSKSIEENLDKTENSDLSDERQREELSKRQDEVSDKMDQLQKEMEKLQEKMNEFDDMPKDQLDKMLEELNKQDNQQLSEQTKQQLQQQQKNQAQENMQQMSQNMQNMKQMMEQMQDAMQMMNQMQVMNDMMKILDNLLTLSKEQENLKSETNDLSPTSPQFNETAQQQDELRRNLSKILQQMAELSQKTFAITPEMGKAMGKAQSEMSESISAMQGRNGALAFQKQGGAMKSLNEAASLTQGAMNQMMQGGQGSGMMSMMQQLQQMSQQQMGLNQLTKMMQQGSMSQEQMAQMQRLAKEQQLIQKSLQQLNKESRESGQSKKLTSNLEKILEEMQEVITGMNTQKITDDLIQTQERILSKLLDAQRSINERDFEKKRESTAGTNFNLESPPELLFSTEEGREKLRDELLKVIREGYSKDYEDLIRKYFEQLQKEQINN